MIDLKQIPTNPGVYLMKDKEDTIIYIGKAKNLKNRINSYFQKAHQDIKTEFLVQKIHHIDFVITGNEKEALILENQLIKKYLPHYNILLKDHKSYLRLAVDYNYRFPRIQTTREKSRKKVRYFGPFPSSSNAKALVEIGEKFFQLRRCFVKIPEQEKISSKTKPCFLYHLKICPGACIGNDNEDSYKIRLKQFINFLQGHFQKVKKEILSSMQNASNHLNYEEAARLRDLLLALDEIRNQQKIYFESEELIDIWGYIEDENKYTFTLLRFNKGVLSEQKVLHTKSILPIQEVFDVILNKVYIYDTLSEQKREEEIAVLEAQVLNIASDEQVFTRSPNKIILPFNLYNKIDYEEFLKETLNSLVQIIDEPTNQWKRLLEMGRENALNQWKNFYKIHQSQAALLELKTLLNLPKLPFRIETYDISNIGDNFAVGSCVVFTDGSPYKNDYRAFKMKYTQTQNDFAMMQETLLRRFKQDTHRPDLIVVDGGKGQVSAARELLKDMNIHIPLIGLAKKEELIILPDKSTPIQLPHTNSALRLLIAGRDEAHRFANRQRSSMLSKKTVESAWDKIHGVGKKRSEILKRTFSSPEEFIQTPLEEIESKTGLTSTIIQSLLSKIQEN